MKYLIFLALVGCTQDPTSLPPADEVACRPGELDHPQALAFDGDHLLVANTGYGRPWGTGSLAVIDMETARVEAVRPTTWQNPQSLERVGSSWWVADTGLYDLSEDVPRMTTPGGLDRWNGNDFQGFELDRGADERAGGPVDLVALGSVLYVSSGIAARVYRFDLTEEKWLPPIEYGVGLGLGSLAADNHRVYVVDYNSDRLHVIDGETGALLDCPIDLGETEGLEGAKAPLVVGRDLYYVLDQAGLLRRVNLDAIPSGPGPCPRMVPETVAVTGLLPNHLLAHGERLYVVHSGENNITALRLSDFRAEAVHVLPPGSNPWHIAVHPERALLAVSEWAAGGLTFIDLADGHQRRLRCGDEGADERPDAGVDPLGSVRIADEIRSAPSSNEAPHHDPALAINGVRGGGSGRGGLDIFSLGVTPDVDDHVVLCWSDGPVRDGPGPDLVVFENPFTGFVDPVIVEVSADGERWVTFPHDYLGADEAVYEADPALWSGFAGVTPVWLHEEDNRVDPFGAAAGGDAFDLADLDDDVLRRDGAVCVRLVSAQARINPDTGAPFVVDRVSDGADIDGVYGR